MEHAREFLTHFTGAGGYAIFFFIIMGSCCGFPFNSDITLITASAMAAAGIFELKILMPLAFIALMCGDTISYFSGRKWGMTLITKRPFRWVITPKKVEMAKQKLNHHGVKFLFIVRFLPFIRTVLFFTSGTLQVKPKVFYFMDASSTLVYLPLIMISSYSAGENIDQLWASVKRAQFVLLGLIFLTVVYFVLKNKTKRKTLKA